VDEYVELVGKWYPKMANLPENKVCRDKQGDMLFSVS
jgi:hypothetical protein